jgi:hypothetical protein
MKSCGCNDASPVLAVLVVELVPEVEDVEVEPTAAVLMIQNFGAADESG